MPPLALEQPHFSYCKVWRRRFPAETPAADSAIPIAAEGVMPKDARPDATAGGQLATDDVTVAGSYIWFYVSMGHRQQCNIMLVQIAEPREPIIRTAGLQHNPIDHQLHADQPF